MDVVECEVCGNFYEYERIELALNPPEHYEFGMCKGCFEKSLDD